MKLIAITLLITFTTLNADINQLLHDCARPMKPTNFTENREIKRYNKAMQNYQTCINTFIEKHKEAREEHTEAINNAINDWNNFANNTKTNKETGNKIYGNTVKRTHSTVGYSDPKALFTDIKF